MTEHLKRHDQQPDIHFLRLSENKKNHKRNGWKCGRFCILLCKIQERSDENKNDVALKKWNMQDFIKMQQNLINLYLLTIYSNPPMCPQVWFLFSWNNIITFRVNKHIFKIQVNSYMPQKIKYNTCTSSHKYLLDWQSKLKILFISKMCIKWRFFFSIFATPSVVNVTLFHPENIHICLR